MIDDEEKELKYLVALATVLVVVVVAAETEKEAESVEEDAADGTVKSYSGTFQASQ